MWTMLMVVKMMAVVATMTMIAIICMQMSTSSSIYMQRAQLKCDEVDEDQVPRSKSTRT